MASNTVDDYKFQGKGLTGGEKKWGANQFKAYQANYPHLHKMADLQLLEELIFHTAMHGRIKENIAKLTKARKDANEENIVISSSDQKALKESIDIQFQLKEKLGLFEDKQKLDAFRDGEQLREDFKEYRRQNPNSFKCTCPSCSFIFFLKRRTDCYEEIAIPLFKDKVLANPILFQVYKEGKITKEEYSQILGTSPDYIDWLEEEIFSAGDKKEETLSPPDNSSEENK